MGVELLIVAAPKDPYIIGEPVVIKEQPAEWGLKEGPPNWVRLVIPDATVEQVQGFLSPLRSVFEYDVQVQNSNGARIEISINPKIVEIFGADKGMRQELWEYLRDNWSATIHQSNPPFSYTLDFAVPGISLQELKEDFEDEAADSLAPHRFHFSAADVQTAINAGGFITLTRAQAADRIIDRLA